MTINRGTEPDLLGAIVEAATAAGRRDPTLALSLLADGQGLIERLLRDYVRQARQEGRIWGEIGLCLGVTKQVAQHRYGG